MIFFRFMLFVLLVLCTFLSYVGSQESATNFYKFVDAFASSTYISEESGSSIYDAKRAIQNNPSYWCSAGGHNREDEVQWIGYLNTRGFLKGIKVTWEYSPEKVKISVSSDGENFRDVVPFRRVSSMEAAFEEIYFFKRIEEATAIKLTLQNNIHKFFGIREIRILGGGNPYFLLVSGITSEHEMCLQVEEGLMNTEYAPVILDSCINAMASGDGREIWKTNSNNQIISAFSNPPMCLSVVHMDNMEKSRIVLYDCLRALEDGDGKSNWIFESNSQIRLQGSSEAYCISQKNLFGNAAGVHDVLVNLDVSVDADSIMDNSHSPENMIDGNLSSYWASGVFPDGYEHIVHVTLDLNKVVEISKIKISWEFAPLHYQISTSLDNQSYQLMGENFANPSIVTVDTLKNTETRYIKITMIRPHPNHGLMGDQFLYGIRSIEVQANHLETVLNHCRDASNSDDARDKYFVEYITEFDQDLTEKLIHIEEDVSKTISSISVNLARLEELLPNIETCLEEKRGYDEHIQESKEKARELNEKVSSLVNTHMIDDSELLRLGVQLGDSSAYPASDCSVIKNAQDNPQSGFYWIKPRCASEALRVFCDMDSSTSIYVWNGNPSKEPDQVITNLINSVEDIKYHCAEVGLEPLVLRSKFQLQSVLTALKKIGFVLNGKLHIPLAYDYACDHGSCSGRFHDLLNGNIDLTTLIYLKTAEFPDRSKNRPAAGVSYDDGSFKFFNLESSEISAILCSTNSTENEFAVQYLNATCETTALEDQFNSIVNTNIIVLCPLGCDSEKYNHVSVYGSKGVYSDNSGICRAAIHADVIDSKGGLVNVTIESGLDSYEGTVNNNIESISLNQSVSGLYDKIEKKGKQGRDEETEDDMDRDESRSSGGTSSGKTETSLMSHRTIRLSNRISECPMDHFQFSQTAFIQRGGMSRESPGVKYNMEDGDENESVEIANMQDQITVLLNNIDAIHGVDSSVVANVQEETIRVLEKTKKELKPADTLSKKQVEDAMNLYNTTENLAMYLYDLSGKYIYDLDKMKERLDELRSIQKVAYNFGTFQLNYETMNFSSYFRVFDSKSMKNKPSNWGYTDSDISGRKHTVGQTKSISNIEIGEGSYAKLKGMNFFDVEITVQMLAKGNGCMGVVFRAKDDFNFYLFEMCDQEGVYRLSKVENGMVKILKQFYDEININNQWNKIKIVTTHANINVYTFIEEGKEVRILSTLDERFLSGTVGLYSQISGQGSFFDELEIRAQPCFELSKSSSTGHSNISSGSGSGSGEVLCPYYKEAYTTTSLPYEISGNSEYNCEYKKEEDRTILGCSNDKIDPDKDSHITVLVKQKKCDAGYFALDLNLLSERVKDSNFEGLKNAHVHILFHYENESNYNALDISVHSLRLISIQNGTQQTLAELKSGEQQQMNQMRSEWMNVKVFFDNTKCKAIISNIKTNSSFQLETTQWNKNNIRRGSVGFKIQNFPQIRIDSLVLSPPVAGNQSTQFVQVGSKAWSLCEKSVHVLNRRASCETDIYPNETKDKHIECIKNFCSECCMFHTQMLSSTEKKECEKHCKKNDRLALKMQQLFEKLIDKCISLTENTEYKKCDKNDMHCRNEACLLCCKKHDPTKEPELKGLPDSETKQIKEKEIIECQFQCNKTHGSLS